MLPTNSQPCSGFTLLEVMVALAIACIILAISYRIDSDVRRTAILTTSHQQAITIAQSELTRACYDGSAPTEKGFTERVKGFRTQTITTVLATARVQDLTHALVPTGRLATLFRLRVTVYWGEGLRVREWSLESSCIVINAISASQ
jgi:prepilin-type N-terminal cleavage/methylation domain-containing protein